MKKQILFALAVLASLPVSAQIPSARVQFIHNAPDKSVDVYVNNVLTFNDFSFRTATPFADVPAGLPLSVAVAPASSTSSAEAFAVFTPTFQAANKYVVTASGIQGNPVAPFTLVTDAGAQESANAGTTSLSFLHGAVNGAAVDVVIRAGEKIVTNLAYGQYTSYFSLPSQEFFIDLKPAGSAAIVSTYRLNLVPYGGKALKVFASGVAGGSPTLKMMAALPDGSVFELPLDPVARVQFINNSSSQALDVYKNGNKFFEDVEYRTSRPVMFIPADKPMAIGLAPANTSSVADTIRNVDYTFQNGKTYIVTAQGIAGNAQRPLILNIYDMGREKGVDTAAVDVAFLHGSPDAPVIDIDERLGGSVLTNFAYNEFRPYVSALPTEYVLDLKPAGVDQIAATYYWDLSEAKGKAVVLFASGNAAGSPDFGLYAAWSDGTVLPLERRLLARLQLVNNSPSAPLDIYVFDQLILDNFEFRTATPFFYIPGEIPVSFGFAPGNSQSSSEVFAFSNSGFENGKTYIIVAGGIPGDAQFPFVLTATDKGKESADSTTVLHLAFLHGAPASPAADLVDLANFGPVLSDWAYGDFSDYLVVDDGPFYFHLLNDADNRERMGTYGGDFTGAGGAAALVFASGKYNGDPDFGLWITLPNGATFPFPSYAPAQIIQNSPAGALDLYYDDEFVDGVRIDDNFGFRTARPYEFFPAGVDFSLAVAGPNSGSIAESVYTLPLKLRTSQSYSFVVNGLPINPNFPLQIAVNPQNRYQAKNPGNVDVNLFHGSPDAPAVDVTLLNGPTLVDNLDKGKFSDYFSVPPGDYQISVFRAGNNQLVQHYGAPLANYQGQAITLFASGFLQGTIPAFEVWAALGNGETFPLPVFTRSTDPEDTAIEMRLAPNPARGETFLQLNFPESAQTRYALYSPAGLCVQEGDLGEVPAGESMHRLLLTELPAGLYYLELTHEKGQTGIRLAVEK